ncbi:MAG: hypothetical protein HC915_19710 [Anaerolineae bacterium]|nr:hypothetical protein [Anaerolineae bacterium]
MNADPLLALRPAFPILAHTNYLVSNSLGAMPQDVYASLQAYADTWASRGVRAWAEGWWDLNVAVGDRIAPLIGAPAGTISLHQNIALALGVLLSAFDFSGPRRKVVIEGGVFPSVYYQLRELLPPEIELHTAPGYDGIQLDDQALVEAIDPQTALVIVSHVLFRSAYIVDVAAVVEKPGVAPP